MIEEELKLEPEGELIGQGGRENAAEEEPVASELAAAAASASGAAFPRRFSDKADVLPRNLRLGFEQGPQEMKEREKRGRESARQREASDTERESDH